MKGRSSKEDQGTLAWFPMRTGEFRYGWVEAGFQDMDGGAGKISSGEGI